MSRHVLDDSVIRALEELLEREDLPDGAVSLHRLARYQARLASGEEARAVREAIEADPELAARLAVLREQDEAFDRAMPWERVKDSVFARAERLGPADRRTGGVSSASLGSLRALLLGACGAALALWLAFLLPPVEPDGPNRYKSGSGLLQARIATDEGARPVESGALLGEGATLQFLISTPHSHLVLLGIDGTGTVSRYVPVGSELSQEIVPGNAVPLEDSFRLDAAPGPEVFLAFLGDEPLLVEDLEQAVHDVAAGSGGSRAVLEVDWQARGLAPQVDLFHVEKE